MEERKKIAIFGWKTGENSFGITVPYYDYFDSLGDVSILAPIAEIDFGQYDLLVIPGGPDVSPNSYGHIPNMFTGKSDPIREYFDKYMIPAAIEAKIPIIGICRGHQAIAAYFGATLEQHMYHNTNLSTARDAKKHGLDIFPEVLPPALEKAVNSQMGGRKTKGGGGRVITHQQVNSLHHQVVMDVPQGAALLGTHYSSKDYKDDKSIEALWYPDNNIVTFQYHPEEIWDKLSRICVRYLLKRGKDQNAEVEKADTGDAIRA